MAESAPTQPDPQHNPRFGVRNRTLVLTPAGYRATDPPPGRRPAPATVSVIQQEAKAFSEVTDHLVAALNILARLGYTIGAAADEITDRLHTATAVAYRREREEAQA